MKIEIKILIFCITLSIAFMFIFTYVSTIGEKTYYVYQVGIYKDEDNKDHKIMELKEKGYEGYYYKKNNQYYVLSMISTSLEEVTIHSNELKGIIKEYIVSSEVDNTKLLKILEGGYMND